MRSRQLYISLIKTVRIVQVRNKGKLWYLITLIPALFMTMVTGCFLFVAKAADGGFGSVIPRPAGYGIGAAIAVAALVLFIIIERKHSRKNELFSK